MKILFFFFTSNLKNIKLGLVDTSKEDGFFIKSTAGAFFSYVIVCFFKEKTLLIFCQGILQLSRAL